MVGYISVTYFSGCIIGSVVAGLLVDYWRNYKIFCSIWLAVRIESFTFRELVEKVFRAGLIGKNFDNQSLLIQRSTSLK